MKMYNETIENLQDAPIRVFNNFIEAWYDDALQEQTTIGPKLSISVEEYFETESTTLFLSWIREAAVRDMIFNFPENSNSIYLTNLKKILDNMTLPISFPVDDWG